MNEPPVAVLYDVHGNLPALQAVLAEAEQDGVAAYALGGDYATFGPWPRETAELVESLPAVVRIRGNVERWLLEKPEAPAAAHDLIAAAVDAAREALGPAHVEWLYGLPERAELDGMTICHGSPVSDIESFAPAPQAGEERLLGGESARTIVFGHTHVQFTRPGPDGTLLVNPGSVGAPLDGDRRAAWALLTGGRIRFRRTEYDVERAVAQMRRYGDWAAPIVYRLEHASDAT